MKAVVLAAGKGTRLAPMGWSKPKCLLEFGDYTLLDNIVNSLVGNGIDNITIVLGYQRQVVEEAMGKHDVHWDVVFNENYADTNTINSLWLARDYLDDDFLYFNADVLFDQRIIPLLLTDNRSTLAIDVKNCGAEEVKVVVDDNKRITSIGKELDPEICFGEFIGIAKFSKTVCKSLIKSLSRYNEELNRKQLFFEAAVHDILQEHAFIAASIGDLNAIEIDCPEDYQQAKQLKVNA